LQVLVVDDDSDTRDFLTTVLEQGAKVTAVASGRSTGAIQQFKPDVLVSDIGMPGEDGYELIAKSELWRQIKGNSSDRSDSLR